MSKKPSVNCFVPGLPSNMMAVVTTGNGGYDKLEYKSLSIPVPASDEVLLRVLAVGVNNTEINTRLGWYSSSVDSSTDSLSLAQSVHQEHKTDGGWNDTTPFPIIQGTDCCGKVVFPNLISYIEADEIRPLLAKTFPLLEIAKAQAEFIKKEHVGNFALIPPN